MEKSDIEMFEMLSEENQLKIIRFLRETAGAFEEPVPDVRE